jgi:hypothetical protein
MANWVATLNIKDIWQQAKNNEITMVELSKEIAKRIKHKFNMKDNWEGMDDELSFILDKLEEFNSNDKNLFDEVFERFYNWADINRIWIETF